MVNSTINSINLEALSQNSSNRIPQAIDIVMIMSRYCPDLYIGNFEQVLKVFEKIYVTIIFGNGRLQW